MRADGNGRSCGQMVLCVRLLMHETGGCHARRADAGSRGWVVC